MGGEGGEIKKSTDAYMTNYEFNTRWLNGKMLQEAASGQCDCQGEQGHHVLSTLECIHRRWMRAVRSTHV
jgi:hypothetical protein